MRRDPLRTGRDFDGSVDRDLYGGSFRMIHDGLPVRLTSITAYQHTRADVFDDIIDVSAAPLSAGEIDESHDQVTQELRASAAPADAPWRGVLGAFYFFERYRNESSYLFFPVTQMPSLFRRQVEHTNGAAVFAHGTYTLWNQLDLTLGLRLAAEWQDVTLDETVEEFGRRHDDDNAYFEPLPRAAAAYHWDGAQMTYASVARGFRAGGFNVLFDDPGDFAFDPESAWTYELGHKARWYGDRLAADVTFFYTDYRDQQVQQFDPVLVRYTIDNAGASRIIGTEAEVRARPFPGLDLWGGAGYQDGRFEQYDDSGLNADYAGEHIPFAPLYTFNIGTRYRRPLVGDVTLFARFDLLGTGPLYANASNDVVVDAYTLANLRAGLEWRGLGFYGFARNLFDEEYVAIGAADNGQTTGFAQPGDPRTFGVTLRAAL